MGDFKLLAIRPLGEKGAKFMKVLEKGLIYKFYNDYKYFDTEGSEIGIIKDDIRDVATIKYEQTIPDDLYYVNDKLKVNISAVVGKNGSGKSTLIELLFAAVYNLALKNVILKKDDYKPKLEIEKDLNVEIYYSIDETIICLKLINQGILAFKGIDSDEPISIAVSRKIKIYNLFKDDLIHDQKNDPNESKVNFISSLFFYTIAINYSLYGLNSSNDGYKWLEPLFHKNDAYQTPIVINPFREDGNIKINTENDLVKQRLLTNLLEPIKGDEKDSLRSLAPNKIAQTLIVKVNGTKTKTNEKTPSNVLEVITKLFKVYTKRDFVPSFDSFLKANSDWYLYQKLANICKKYPSYKKYYEIVESGKDKLLFFVDDDVLIQTIFDDSSHITFKIKQAMNFIACNHLKMITVTTQKKINIEALSQSITKTQLYEKDIYNRDLNIIELLPPSFFEVKIKFKDGSYFDDFSSGEKQKIHSVSSIIYHLINLNSVFKNGQFDEKTDKNLYYSYGNVNVIFDEVELYFHPDIQRSFINYLLEYLMKVNSEHLVNIKSLNVLFSTHSPFILSDIPNANVLRLNDGKPKSFVPNEQTFGANIHDLLANDFFMEEGFMGELAKNKIKSVIDFLQEKSDTTKEWDEIKARKFIDIIGEPLILSSLNELYYQKFMDNDDKIELEIERLKALKKK